MLCNVMLCYVVLCYVMLWHVCYGRLLIYACMHACMHVCMYVYNILLSYEYSVGGAAGANTKARLEQGRISRLEP